MSQDNKRNFILHGSILAMAGIFVRIIGMVYRIPVLNIIGSEGNGIYVTAYNVYNIILVLSSYGLPMAVSKLISARFTKRRYKNAAKVLRCSLTVGASGRIFRNHLMVMAWRSNIPEYHHNEDFRGILPGKLSQHLPR